MYQTKETNSSTYSISSVNDIHLRSGKVLSKDTPLVIEEIEREIPRKTDISIVEEPSDSQDNQDSIPPSPERLSFQQPESPSKHDFLDELNNVCIKIPLLQAIKNIPIYAKTIKDLCLKKAGRKKKKTKNSSSKRIVSQPNVNKYNNGKIY